MVAIISINLARSWPNRSTTQKRCSLRQHQTVTERANIRPPLEERCRISASELIEAWAMAMNPERRKAFEAALDSLKEDELRALEGLTVVRMEHKDIEMIAHAMGEIVRLKMKERGIT